MKLGVFMIPLHNPARNLMEVLAEDRDAVIRADELGMVVIRCGEYVSSITEPIASSLMFFVPAIAQTKNIIMAFGVINLPQQHPSHVAAQEANCDYMCRGGYIMGIGTGGLISDFKLLGLTDKFERREMMPEAIDTIHAI